MYNLRYIDIYVDRYTKLIQDEIENLSILLTINSNVLIKIYILLPTSEVKVVLQVIL